MKSKRAFTIIELTIAMAFISVLLISITVLVIRITNLYTKGSTIKAVNSTARFLIDDLQRTVAASPTPSSIRNAYRPDRNRFCTGTYSYIWNTPRGTLNSFSSPDNREELKLVKIEDSTRAYCNARADNTIPLAGAIVLLSPRDESSLILYDFAIFANDARSINTKTRQTFYAASFVLGTRANNGLISPTINCIPPADSNNDFSYCSINKFNFAMISTGNTY